MKAFFMNLLCIAIKPLIGAIVWDRVKQTVLDLMDSALSGDEKRAKAQADLKAAFADVPSYLRNLAIEVAVAQFKS